MENTLGEFKTVIQGFLVWKDKEKKGLVSLKTIST
jgi:hypothetical protein